MVNRREFLGFTAGAGAALALTPNLLCALQQSSGKLIQRAIPSTGEMLPVISFGPRPTAPPAPGPIPPMPTDLPAAKEVLEAFVDNGGKVVDVMHGGDIGEEAARTAADELGIQNKLFWTTQLWIPATNGGPLLPGAIPKVDPAVVRAAVEAKLAKFKVSKIDLVIVGINVDIPTYLAVLREMKKEGRIRYIGVYTLALPTSAPVPPFGNLESIMRNEPIDFVATDYSVGDRRAEEKILPLAKERKIGFLAYFPFDRARGLKRVGNTPLPDWAAEFDAKTWSQFFLKYVISHPAVIVARTGTTKAAHMIENIGGGIGRLPNEAMRKRMAEFVDSIQPPKSPASPTPPGVITDEQRQRLEAENKALSVVLPTAILDRYVGEYQHVAVGTMMTVRRDGDTLLAKVHGSISEEFIFLARSETRFASAPVFTLEFQLDGKGKVTGAIWGQGPTSIPLERK